MSTKVKVKVKTKTKVKEIGKQRTIKSVYYADHKASKVVRVTSAKWANNAVPNAVKHMQFRQYNAVLCEVYDEDGGKLHAVIMRTTRRIEIIFRRKVEEGM